ncbi:hypothetical protein BpHYR1_013778 [Brachionus plicatilis]|uniref:Uncharacterized protein n=1 Tax=Brachionus plicatilis TaxID=10195 RepID=A0A3M7RAM7_BRAPC|nr:hypothetical protein BpHYR1_013778 [Brachionus plicatilis]
MRNFWFMLTSNKKKLRGIGIINLINLMNLAKFMLLFESKLVTPALQIKIESFFQFFSITIHLIHSDGDWNSRKKNVIYSKIFSAKLKNQKFDFLTKIYQANNYNYLIEELYFAIKDFILKNEFFQKQLLDMSCQWKNKIIQV